MVSNKFFDKKIKIGLGILILLIILNIIVLVFNSAKKPTLEYLTANVIINNKLIKTELATTFSQQYLGLSNRQTLCADCGMLFVFSDFDEREFVMRDMNFPLDIIFISRGKIINISENLKPEGSNPTYIYKSIAPADMVLEVPGGYAKKQGIKVGDLVSVNK